MFLIYIKFIRFANYSFVILLCYSYIYVASTEVLFPILSSTLIILICGLHDIYLFVILRTWDWKQPKEASA